MFYKKVGADSLKEAPMAAEGPEALAQGSWYSVK